MKKIFLLFFVFFLAIGFSFGQAQVSFKESTHDFGQVEENGGQVTYKFVFTNTGDEPLIVDNVKASCGCTTPNWTKNPVPPGGEGFVTAAYDPKNRPGKFNKSLTITSNAFPSSETIFIKGEVIGN